MTVQYLDTPENRRLAYRFTPPETGRTFVWLTGFKSDMKGTKVSSLEQWAIKQGHGFLAFDYSGHGQSSEAFDDGTISSWREDALAAIDALTEGDIVLVGSSMGGWMALLAALARPERVKAMVLLAPAPDFTQKLMWPNFPPEIQKEITETGLTMIPSEYDDAPYAITKQLIDDGESWSILDAPIEFSGPVRILQGMDDPDVPWQHAFKLVERLTSQDLVFSLIKDGDHRLSREQDIARLIATCSELAG